MARKAHNLTPYERALVRLSFMVGLILGIALEFCLLHWIF